MRPCGRSSIKKTYSTPVFALLIIFLLTLPTFSFGGQFKITRVYDGDTVKAHGHDIEIKVRLVGIDGPETTEKKREPGQPVPRGCS